MHIKQIESYPKKIKKYTDYKSAPWGLENLYEIVNNFLFKKYICVIHKYKN